MCDEVQWKALVPGWTGTASIKWVGSIEISREPLYSPWNATEYMLEGPDYPACHPARGPIITGMPVTSVLDLDWPATLQPGPATLWGRAYAGEERVVAVRYSIDGRPWRQATLVGDNEAGCWTRFRIEWDAASGAHNVRTRARDARGRTQPDSVLWNKHGYLYNAVVEHPIEVCA